jgi:hypothetical protein
MIGLDGPVRSGFNEAPGRSVRILCGAAGCARGGARGGLVGIPLDGSGPRTGCGPRGCGACLTS